MCDAAALLCSLPAFSIFSLAPRALSRSLLDTLFFRSDPWYDVIKWIVKDFDAPYLWRASNKSPTASPKDLKRYAL